MRTRVSALRCPAVRRYCLRRFFLKMRTFGPRCASRTIADHLGAVHGGGAGQHLAAILADHEHLVEGDGLAGFAGAVELDLRARLDAVLMALGLNHCKHGNSPWGRGPRPDNRAAPVGGRGRPRTIKTTRLRGTGATAPAVAGTRERGPGKATGNGEVHASRTLADRDRDSVSSGGGSSPFPGPLIPGPCYLSSTRLPRTRWELSVFRKLGRSRSISSKNDDSAGVVWLEL